MAGPSCAEPGTPVSIRSVESAGVQVRPSCAPPETVAPVAEVVLPGPLVTALGVTVPHPETSKIPRHANPARWVMGCLWDRNIKRSTVLTMHSGRRGGFQERKNRR
jgi:hypothetical protein